MISQRFFRFFLLIILFMLNLQAADSCTSPTAVLSLNNTLTGQYIDKPFINGQSGSGEALYYKITLSQNGTLVLRTNIDATHSSDTVDTYAELLDSSCAKIEDVPMVSSNPRLIKEDKSLVSGTYYLKVYNKIDINDGSLENANGYFQIQNTLTTSLPSHDISFFRDHVNSMQSGSEIIQHFYVRNNGSVSTAAVKVTIPSHTPAGNLNFVSKVNSTQWSCSSGDPIVCTLNSGTIATNEIQELQLKYKSNYATSDRTVSNQAKADITFTDATTMQKTATRSVDIYKEIPGIHIEKSAPDSVIRNNTFDYTWTIDNNGTLPDDNVTVTDKIGTDFDIVSINYDASVWKNCGYSGKNVSCELINPLQPGYANRQSFQIQVKATGDPANPEGVTHYAIVNADTVMGHVSDDDAKNVTIIAQSFIATLTKTASVSQVMVGHDAYYNVTVANTGNSALSNVRITDNVPSELTLSSLSNTSGWDCSASNIASNSVDCTLNSDLAAGAAKSLRVNVKGKTVANSVTNTATVNTTEAPPANGSDTLDVITATPSIKIYKGGPSNIKSLHKYYYTFSVQNDGSEIDHNVTVTDTIDTQLTLPTDWDDAVDATWSCGKSGQTVTCTYANDFYPGDSTPTLYIKVQAPYVTSDTPISNTAVVNADGSGIPLTDSSTVSTTINTPTEGIKLDKTVSSPTVNSAAYFTYTLNVENNGTLDETTIKVIDDLPTQLDGNGVIDSGTDADFDCSASSGKHIECTLASLPAGVSKLIKIKVKAPIVTTNTTITNHANTSAKIVVAGFVDDTTTANGHVSVTILPPASDLIISKTAPKSVALENDLFYYTIKIRNNSIADEHNVTMTDDVPHDLQIQNIVASGWTCTTSSNLITCQMSDLLANTQAQDINISVKAPNTIATQKTITNTAKVTSVKEIGGKTAHVDITLMPANKALNMHISSHPSTVYAGNEYYYKIFMTNNSGRDIDDINITDTLPADVTYVRYDSGGWNCHYNSVTRLFSCDNNGTKFHGGDKEINLYVTAPSYETNVTNSASIVSNLSPEVIDGNVTTTVIGKTAKLTYAKSQSDKAVVKINEPFTYSVAVFNAGDDPSSEVNATDINVSFALDQNISVLSYSAQDWNCSQSGQNFTCIYTKALDVGITTPDVNLTVSGASPGQKITYIATKAKEMPTSVTDSISVDIKDVVHTDLSLSIDDSLDPVDANDGYNYTLIVRNPHISKAVEDIVVDINTTSTRDYTYIDYSDVNVWNCSHSTKHVRCLLKNNLPADSNVSLQLNVQAPNLSTIIDVNASVSSQYVIDFNKVNNSATESTDVIDANVTGDAPRVFTKVPILGNEDTNIFGDIITIGNQSICEKNAFGQCREPSYMVNDLITQKYVNLDTFFGMGHKSATNAKFTISSDDEVVWAGLYWMGRIDKTQAGASTKMKNANKVFFRHNSDTTYHKLYSVRHADAIDNNGTLIQVDKFNYINSSDYFDYQGMADVTAYVKAHRGGTYWVADVQSSEGENITAGWNLVVIVMDTNANPAHSLKNITLFDGFEGVWKSPGDTGDAYPDEVNAHVSGFLTPANGLIDSSLSFFAFEGDRLLKDNIQISDDASIMHTLVNAKNPADDVVNGTISKNGITVSDRMPHLDNTSGIDIDQFYLGDINGTLGSGIIKNGQTSTDIKIASDGDRFFLGMFAFATSLYDPVCYNQKLQSADFSSPLGSEVHLGDEIGIEVEFHNKEVQTLNNFKALTDIDTILKDDNTSFELKNINASGNLEASFTAQNTLFKFSKIDTGDANQTEVIVNAGKGSNGTNGGDLRATDSIFFRYKAVVADLYDVNKSHNIYKAIYAPANKKVMVPPCGAQPSFPTVKKNNTSGFAITHKNGVTDGILDGFVGGDISKPSNENHLFTQVSDTNFSVDIVALDDNNNKMLRSNNYKGILKLDIVDTSDTTKECKTYPVIDSDYVSMDAIVSTHTISYSTAKKSVAFRTHYLVDSYGRYIQWGSLSNSLTNFQTILQNASFSDHRCQTECLTSQNLDNCRDCVYKNVDNGGFSKYTCSTDSFAIKPKNISIDVNSTATNLKGGKTYSLDFNASFSAYDQTIDASTGTLNRALNVPSGCTLLAANTSIIPTGGLVFNNGIASLSSFTYPNVGDVNITFEDHAWTIYDQNSTDANMSDCILGSNTNTPDSNGKVGCNIASKKMFHFVPDTFSNSIILKDFNASGFVYLSPGDSNMAATIAFQTKAVLANGSVATNYTNGCFAQDVNYQFSFTNPTIPANAGGISYFDDGGVTSTYHGTPHSGDFDTTQSHFNSGIANIDIKFNFNKNAMVAVNPFEINKNDFNITGIVDTNGASGSDFNRSVNQSIPFYYGRLHIPDITVDKPQCTMPLYYEIYCKDCNKSRYTLANNPESVDSVNWYNINTIHTTALQGSFSGEHTNNGVHVGTKTLKGVNLSLNGIKPPYKDKVVVNPSSWLLFNPFVATTKTWGKVDFTSAAKEWAGKGKLGYTVDSNISKRDIKKMDW